MTDFRRYIRLIILLLVTVLLCMSCNPSSNISNGTPEPEESRFATSESGLTNDEIDATVNAPISPFDPDERKFPPGFGDTRVEYNHLVKFDQMIGEIGLKTEVEVIDYVPIRYTAIGLAPRKCGGETMDWPFLKLQGEKELQVNGRASLIIGPETCNCSFADTIDVSIEGVTHPEWGTEDCDEIMVSLAFNETWYTNPNWDCNCDDSIKNVIGDMLQNTIPSGSPPDIENHTMKFNTLCPGQYLEEWYVGVAGTGTYRWTWRPGDNERGEPFATQGALSIDENIYGYAGPPNCVISGGEAHWGPPLSSVEPSVLEWFTEGYQ